MTLEAVVFDKDSGIETQKIFWAKEGHQRAEEAATAYAKYEAETNITRKEELKAAAISALNDAQATLPTGYVIEVKWCEIMHGAERVLRVRRGTRVYDVMMALTTVAGMEFGFSFADLAASTILKPHDAITCDMVCVVSERVLTTEITDLFRRGGALEQAYRGQGHYV